MSEWKCYQAVYEAKAPIHIGYRRLGIINRTRYYILGKNFWGAATAILARSIMREYSHEIYTNVGDFVKKNLIFSHFYVFENRKILYPQFTENGLNYGKHSENEFESRYVSSYISTAVETSSRTAEEDGLHEIEFINSKYKDEDEIKTTQFFGHVFVYEKAEDKLKEKLKNGNLLEKVNLENMDFNQDGLEQLFSELFIGGERNYGFGRIKLKEIKETNNPKAMIFEKYNIDLEKLHINYEDNKEAIEKDEGWMALSHVLFNGNIKSIKGDIEPLVGRIWSKKGAGQEPKPSGVALTPGTRFEFEGEIKIGDYGVWKILSGFGL